MPKTVSVAFPLPLRKTFSYQVPAGAEARADVGCRVVAPFGERLLSGVIVGVDDDKVRERDLRPLAEVIDDNPSLSPELLETTRRLSERFFSPWGELIRAALPVRLASPEKSRYEITPAGAAAISFAPENERALLRELLERGRLTRAELLQTGLRTEPLRRIEASEWVRAAASRSGKRNAVEKIYSVIRLDAAARQAAAGRSEKAREALLHLESLGRGASTGELSAAGFSAALLRRLAASGALSVSEQARRPALPLTMAGEDRPVEALTPAQVRALDEIIVAIHSRRFAPCLLYGVTGSGKTEVYLRAIAAALAAGRGAVWLVPEIGLTPVFARSLARRFGEAAVVLHSALSDGERARAWEALHNGRARAVIGPRSAVFSPVDDAGIFIIDEEHDSSYKQEESPRYDARDAAALRAQLRGSALVLGSATPALETLFAAQKGKIALLRLPDRIANRPLPKVVVVDLKGEAARPDEKGTPLFSHALRERLSTVFSAGEQAILLVPRRGYAPFLLCRSCGHDFRCGQCSVARVVHRRVAALLCHYCGERRPIPRTCPECAGTLLEAIGAGTERAAERFAELFPGVTFGILDADTARRRSGAATVIAAMENGRIQALIGTQMVAKGHHFENVTSIGILSADTLLNFPDFRAGEKTFQLIAQACGRAGRGEKPGTVHIQTFHPENPAILAGAGQNAEAFATRELEFRRTFFYPPFCEMALVEISGPERERAAAAAAGIARNLQGEKGLRVSESAPAPLERLRGHWRFQVLLRSRSRRSILTALEAAIPDPPSSGPAVSVNIDPRNLM